MIKEICNTDAMTYLLGMENDSVDLIILDPDYNDWEMLIDHGIINECVRVLKDSGNLLCFTKQPFDYDLRIAVEPIFRREIIWTFDNGGAWVSKKMPLVSFQKIYWCVKSKDFFFEPRTGQNYADITRDFKRTNKVFGDWKEDGREFKKSEKGTWLRDHLHFNKPQCGAIPAKPHDLVKILISCFSPEGGVVYDPFAGTGMISKVADDLNREVITTEINEERCQMLLDYFFGKVI